MKVKEKNALYRTKVFGLEEKTTEIRSMIKAVKTVLPPGMFVPFTLRNTNEEAFSKAIKYVASKNKNTWTIKINYVSEGSFFKLEEVIKEALKIEHVIYDTEHYIMRVLVPKAKFDTYRSQLKDDLQKWSLKLDPEDTRLFNSDPEVAYLFKDDKSSSANSYSSRSIESIMSLEIEEIEIIKDQT